MRGETATAPIPLPTDETRVIVQQACDRHNVPGLALGVAVNGETALAEGFGHRDRERGLPVTPDTIFGIASVTKSFTAMAIMQLMELGKLSVDDPVIRYLPEFRTPDSDATREITIHHLLTHTTGLPPLPSRYFAFAGTMRDDPAATDIPVAFDAHPQIDTFEDLMAFIANHDFRLLGAPGRYFSYSNEGYALLGAIVERVSGRAYPEYVSDRILTPAGMTRTTFDVESLRTDGNATVPYAKLPEDRDGRAQPQPSFPWWHTHTWLPAGCLYSTVNDLLRFLEILRTEGVVEGTRILSTESVRRMTHPWVLWGPSSYYGHGLDVIRDYCGFTLIEHGGSRKAISAHIALVPECGLSAVMIANLVGVPVDSMILQVMNSCLQLPTDVRRPVYSSEHEMTPESPQLERFVGEYRSGEGSQVTVTLRGGVLMVADDSEVELPARQVTGDTIVIQSGEDGDDTYLRFVFDDAGIVHAVVAMHRMIPRVA